MVTVTSEPPAFPSLFPLIPYGNSPDSNNIAVGCLAKDFLPDAVTFSWNNRNNQSISNFKKFPSVRNPSGSYTAASQATVSRSDWDSFFPFFCKADHSQGNRVARVVRATPTSTLEPEMIVRAPPLRAFSNPWLNSTITCEVTNLCTDKVKLEWLKDEKVLTSGFTTSKPIPSNNGGFTIRSKLVVTKQDWTSDKVFSCEVKSKQYNNTMEISNTCGGPPSCQPVEVETIPPTFADIYQTSSAKLTCRISNIPFGQEFSQLNVTWRRASDDTQLPTVMNNLKEQTDDLFYTDATATVCATEWKSGEVFICKVTFEGLLVKPVEKSLKKDNDGTPYTPSVYILPPPSEQLALREVATLTCFVKGLYPSDVFVQWLHNEKPVSESEFYTSQPILESKVPKQYFVFSILTIREEQWSRGDVYTCVVGHETLPFNTTQKTVDKNTGKPSIVNVSLVLSDIDNSCY